MTLSQSPTDIESPPAAHVALRVFTAATCVLLCFFGLRIQAQSSNALPESSVKAAFLYKFVSYVEWPTQPGAQEPFKFGVLGSDEVADELRTLINNRTLEGRPIAVVSVQRTADLNGVQILFVGRGAMKRLPAFARQCEKLGVLVVTEADDALARGGVINFVLVDGHVRFEVSLPAAKRAGIKLSSRLLAVAKSVETEMR